MRPAPHWAVALLIVAVVALAGLIGIGARQLPGGEVRPPPFVFQVDPATVVTWVFLVLVVAGAVLLLYVVLTTARRPGGGSRRRRTSPIAIVAALIVIAALILYGPMDRIREVLSGIIPTGADAVASGGGAVTPVGMPGPTGSPWWVAVLVVAVALVVVALAAMWRRAAVIEDRGEVASDDVVEDAAREALAELRLGDDPRSAVLRAYAAMEQALAEAGWERRTWEAPGEYLARVAPRIGSDSTAGLTLTRVFEVARFGQRAMSEADRAAAEEALIEVRARVTQ